MDGRQRKRASVWTSSNGPKLSAWLEYAIRHLAGFIRELRRRPVTSRFGLLTGSEIPFYTVVGNYDRLQASLKVSTEPRGGKFRSLLNHHLGVQSDGNRNQHTRVLAILVLACNTFNFMNVLALKTTFGFTFSKNSYVLLMRRLPMVRLKVFLLVPLSLRLLFLVTKMDTLTLTSSSFGGVKSRVSRPIV